MTVLSREQALRRWAYREHATLGFSERQLDAQHILARVDALTTALKDIAGFGMSRPKPDWDPVVSADVVRIAKDALAGRADTEEGARPPVPGSNER